MFDFDRVIERRGTHATKWDNMARLSGIEAPDAIPMWVADMDFAAPPGVTEALATEVEPRRSWLLRRHWELGSGACRLDGAQAWPADRSGLGEPDAGGRVSAGSHPSGVHRPRG